MKRILTGIEGIDEMLNGGLPEGRCYLISGGPGSGKTTLAMQFLVYGVEKNNENGLYISLEEKPKHLIENMSQFGWELERLQKERKLMIVDASPIRNIPGKFALGEVTVGKREFSLRTLVEIIKTNATTLNAKRIVIDPITTFMFQYPDISERRNAILDLIGVLTELETTSFVTTESQTRMLERDFQAEEFLAHGVISLHTIIRNGIKSKGIEIRKMRGISHDEQLRPYEILRNGITVYSKEKAIQTK